jgi:hypothetical protein
MQRAAGKRNAAFQVKIPLTVREGFHVNSNHPSEDYMIPLSLTWSDPGALQPGAVTFPKPVLEKYEFAEKPLSVYTGTVDLVASFKVGPAAAAGPGAATGKLKYQACSSRACYPPKTIEVSVPYLVE